MNLIAFTPESIIYPYNIAAPDALQREKSRGYFSNAVKATAELGAKIMTINSGYGYEKEPGSESWQRSAEMLAILTRIAEKEGITIALETLRPEESKIVTTIRDAKRMFEAIHSDSFKLMIDTTTITVASETMEQWFSTFGKDIIHMHFIDGNPYGHLAWGDGVFPLDQSIKVLNQFQYEGFLGQEITDERYFKEPYLADKKVVDQLSRFF